MRKSEENQQRKEKLTIYLAKDTASTDSALIKTDKADAPIPVALEGGKALLYIKKEVQRNPPPWTKIFTDLPNIPDDAFGSTNSVGAILIYRTERTFLLAFGHGFHLIKDDAVERDFGLRVTLNSVASGKLRSLDKASYDHNPLNHRTQSSKDLDLLDLDVNSETEILYAITGLSKEPTFGSHVTGRDALTLMVATDIHGIEKILLTALEKYNEKLPQELEWVDNIHKVRDSEEVSVLDLYLDDLLTKSHESSSLWLGEPEVIDWEAQSGYSFDMYPRTPRHVVLELSQLQKYLAEKGQGLTVNALKNQSIHVNNAEYVSIRSWSAYRCLYVEMAMGDGQYILRNGTWYRVKNSFVDMIDSYLSRIPSCQLPFPTYSHKREDEYNDHVAKVDGSFHIMDKKNTAIGGPYDKIEFCDLIKDESSLIYVKYYRSSSTLSHLFAQASVAAETFVREEDFRLRLNGKLPEKSRLKDPTLRPDPSRYKIIYAIATTKDIPKNLPFFSKVTLKNAFMTLQALDFRVELAKIAIDPNLLKTATHKPK
ncbi:MAG: TIGR04141 family sporadically distributed protein [Pseudomonadota bacterium]